MEKIQKERELFPVKITENTEITPGIFILSWKRAGSFSAGQVVKISTDDQIPPRIYSICSGTEEDKINILFNIKQDGLLTPRLAAAKSGTTIYVSKPYGTFTCDLSPAYWIAAGTGIAPFYSMFRSGLSKNKILIHGARHLTHLFFTEEFKQELGSGYIPCSSAEQEEGIFRGRITDYISTLDNLPRDYMYYLCGGGMMVIDVRDLLIDKGIPYEHILSEIYF